VGIQINLNVKSELFIIDLSVFDLCQSLLSKLQNIASFESG